MTVNCGAIPKDLAESEFFGYEKGAFTGATERMKQGKFELADGGTILLDEVRELSLEMQVKLLRVLEEKRFYRLGGTKEISVDVRVIAASNRELLREVEAGRFREDLYYRLNVALIRIPPLRERRDDIEDLCVAFLREFGSRFNRPVPVLAPDALKMLQQLAWKGNVRELRNAMERVMLLNNVPTLTAEQFSFLRTTPGAGIAQMAERQDNGKMFVLDIPSAGHPDERGGPRPHPEDPGHRRGKSGPGRQGAGTDPVEVAIQDGAAGDPPRTAELQDHSIRPDKDGTGGSASYAEGFSGWAGACGRRAAEERHAPGAEGHAGRRPVPRVDV